MGRAAHPRRLSCCERSQSPYQRPQAEPFRGESVRTILMTAGVAALAFATGAAAARAQAVGPPDDAAQMGEVVVTAPHYVPDGSRTATKTDASLIEAPQSVSVATLTRTF